MKSKKWLLVILVLILTGWLFRFELISWFQYQRLQSIDCNIGNKKDDCFNKFWVHRVNSIERLNLVKNRFKGCEADIVFDPTQNSFLVYHPPAEDQHLRLDLFLRAAHASGQQLWLDTRMVDSLSMKQAFDFLENLNSQLHFKSAVILELYDLQAANYFAEGGYIVSLNIPPENLLEERGIENISGALSAKVKYISQESKYVGQLKKYFPGKKILTWSLSFNNYLKLNGLEKLLNDDQVAIVLVNYKSRYYY